MKFDKQLKEFLEQQTEENKQKSEAEVAESETEEFEEEVNVEDILPIIFEEKQTKLAVAEDDGDLLDDYKFARSNLYGLIGRTNGALDLALKIASMSEHPRAMEVAASLIKTSADVSKQLLELQSKVRDKGTGGENDTPKTVNNTQNNYYNNPSEQKEIDDVEAQLSKINGKNKKD